MSYVNSNDDSRQSVLSSYKWSRCDPDAIYWERPDDDEDDQADWEGVHYDPDAIYWEDPEDDEPLGHKPDPAPSAPVEIVAPKRARRAAAEPDITLVTSEDAPTFAPVSRHLLLYPLARNPKTAEPWQRLADRSWRCALHPAPRTDAPCLVLTWPRGDDEPRHANRYDVDVLMRLTAMALRSAAKQKHLRAMKAGKQAMKTAPAWSSPDRWVLDLHPKAVAATKTYHAVQQRADGEDVTMTFRSLSALTTLLGRDGTEARRRRSVQRSLQLWSHLRIETKGQKVGSPLTSITVPETGRGTVTVVVRREWLALNSAGWWCKVQLPMPMESEAAFNLRLGLYEMRNYKTASGHGLSFHRVCQRIGIGTECGSDLRKSDRLNATLARVNQYLSEHGAGVSYVIEPKGTSIRFIETRLD